MRVLLVCTALCALSPASTHAFSDIEPSTSPTSAVSFAYATRHDVGPVAKSAMAAMQPAQDVSVYRNEDAEPLLLPVDQKLPSQLSRAQLCNTVASVAAANDLPVSFFANLIQQESAFRTTVVSPVGAQGIAQFMPRTARAYGLENPFDPIHAINVSGQFLRELVGQFGNLGLAAAAYNAGSGRVMNWVQNRGKLPDETQHYVKTITGRPAMQWARPKKDDEAKMPAHARCPELLLASADAVAMKEPVVKVALADPLEKKIVFRKGKSIVIAVASDKAKSGTVKLSPENGSLIIMVEEKGAKPTKLASAGKGGSQPAPAKIQLASAESKPVVLGKTIVKVAGGKASVIRIVSSESATSGKGAAAKAASPKAIVIAGKATKPSKTELASNKTSKNAAPAKIVSSKVAPKPVTETPKRVRVAAAR